MKGIGKAIARTPFTVTSKIGMSKKSNDPQFDECSRMFTAMEAGAEKLIKDTKTFVEAVNNLFTSGASFSTHFAVIFQPIAGEHDLVGKHPDSEHTIRNVTKYEAAMDEMKGSIAPELELIESRIVGPSKEFQAVLKLIRKTMTKRDHKLIDYDRFNNSLTKLRDKKEKSLSDEKNLFKLEQDFEQATNEYEYINNALKVDLPRFSQLAAAFIEPLFYSFFYMQLNIYYLILEKMNSFADTAKFDITNVPAQQIQSEYEGKRTDAWERMENLQIAKRLISTSRLVQQQRAQGGLGRSATSAGSPSASTTSLSRPSYSSLKKPPPPPPSLHSQADTAPPPYSHSTSAGGNGSAMASAAVKRPPPPPPLKPKPKVAPQPQYVTAMYDFTAQAAGDLSFKVGDRIELVERSASAEDWWTGKLHGVQGVFPGNYVQDA